jgi:uncharacterized membrane protein HdeD (DUF308 family)
MSNSPLSTPPGDRFPAMRELLVRNWWALALRGAFAILFGILTFAMPGVTLATLVILFSAYMLVDGIFAIVAGVRAAQRHERWGTLILEGLANILAAAVAFLWPAITVLVFVYLIAGWSIVSGILLAAAAFRLEHGRWLLALSGVMSVVFGVLLAVMPIAGAVVLTLWLGAYALIFGALLVGVAFRLKSQAGKAPLSGPDAHRGSGI